MLSEIKTHIYVIKFQKRDLFYVHIFIVVISKNDINLTNVDNAIKTIIFDLIVNRKFYDLIFKHIIHKNCFENKNVVCYNNKNNCIKFFFKSLSEIIDLNDRSNYSVYERYVIKYIENML